MVCVREKDDRGELDPVPNLADAASLVVGSIRGAPSRLGLDRREVTPGCWWDEAGLRGEKGMEGDSKERFRDECSWRRSNYMEIQKLQRR